MSYALFSHADQVSPAFASKAEVWDHAAVSGLVLELGSFEEDPPRRILNSGYAIRECAPADVLPLTASMSRPGLTRLVAAAVSPPSAAVAS